MSRIPVPDPMERPAKAGPLMERPAKAGPLERSVLSGLLLATMLVAACGLPNDKTLGELDDKDRTKLCEELAKFEPVTITCDEAQITLGPSPVSECEADYAALSTECSATVGDVRDCMDAIQNVQCGDDLLAGPCGATFVDDCLPSE